MVTIEYYGQTVSAEILRSFLFLHRVKLFTKNGYFLRWVPKWKVIPE